VLAAAPPQHWLRPEGSPFVLQVGGLKAPLPQSITTNGTNGHAGCRMSPARSTAGRRGYGTPAALVIVVRTAPYLQLAARPPVVCQHFDSYVDATPAAWRERGGRGGNVRQADGRGSSSGRRRGRCRVAIIAELAPPPPRRAAALKPLKLSG
jgi:hypothetical protein